MQLHEVLIRVLVVAEAAGLGVERHLRAEPVGVVHEVTKHRAVVGFLHIAIGHFGFASAAGRDERTPVAAGRHLTGLDRQFFPGRAALREILVADNLTAVLEVILVLHLMEVALVVHIADVEERVLPIGILREREHRVRRLALVVPLKAAAERHHTRRAGELRVKRPARDVELVRALVVHVAVTSFPEPVPVIVDEIRVVIGHRGAAPEIPVEMAWRRGRGLHADRIARLAAIAVGNLQLAELARLNRLVQAGDLLVAAALRTVLDYDAVALLSFDGRAALSHVVAHRFLDVDVFTRLRAPDRHERVPMVGRRDGDRIESRVFEGAPHVRKALGGKLLAGLRFQIRQRLLQHLLVRIDEVGDLDVLLLGPAADVTLAPAVQADDSDAEAIVRADRSGIGRCAASEQGCAGGEGRGLEEGTPCEHSHGWRRLRGLGK